MKARLCFYFRAFGI